MANEESEININILTERNLQFQAKLSPKQLRNRLNMLKLLWKMPKDDSDLLNYLAKSSHEFSADEKEIGK